MSEYSELNEDARKAFDAMLDIFDEVVPLLSSIQLSKLIDVFTKEMKGYQG